MGRAQIHFYGQIDAAEAGMSTLREQVAQAMRDNNGPEHWMSPQLVPVGHYADVALAVVAEWLRSDEAVSAARDGVHLNYGHVRPLACHDYAHASRHALADLIAGGE